MADVVCAIRGGPGSYQTRLAALQRAVETGVAVHFVSVVDPIAYGPLHEGEQRAIRAEMAWRDVALARATASHAELEDVRFTVTVRVGELAETIAGFAREMDAGSILIGNPRAAADAVLVDEAAAQFADGLRQETGIPVFMVGSAG
jgi:hypothetical protein